jgi:hypothetical protein
MIAPVSPSDAPTTKAISATGRRIVHTMASTVRYSDRPRTERATAATGRKAGPVATSTRKLPRRATAARTSTAARRAASRSYVAAIGSTIALTA